MDKPSRLQPPCRAEDQPQESAGSRNLQPPARREVGAHGLETSDTPGQGTEVSAVVGVD